MGKPGGKPWKGGNPVASAGPGPMTLSMTPLACAALPPITGTLREAAGEEVLAKQPAGTGGHWWIRVRKDGLGTQQAREALARAVQRDADIVSDAGNRDRRGSFIQWFSIPADAIDHPGPLRRAGAHNKMKVLEITSSHKPFTVAAVERIRWRLRFKDGAADNGYLKAKNILDHLRHHGLPNFISEDRMGVDGSWARWGRMIAEGQRLPEAVLSRGRVDAGRCLRAYQEHAFNLYLAKRLTDGQLGTVLLGDTLRSRTGVEFVAEDVEAVQKRVDTWEAAILGPVPGTDYLPASGDAGLREQAWIEAEKLTSSILDRLKGGERRALRNQPAKVQADPEGADLVVSCELPTDVHVNVLAEELSRPR